ncbi:MAG TPA: YigZ family protein [Bacteroidaceae bacterium]|nr:YigZ family protein [Bacteroidaceae bacterium]
MKDTYRTISKVSEGLYKDKGSKFISFAFPVSEEDEIKRILEEIKKRYHDARHHCYAWCLGADKSRYRAHDDGEPSNSAGKPILGKIHSNDLTNILIVVVRYFGGTLLGTGGLVNAYREAAADAVHNNRIVQEKVYAFYELFFEYPQMNDVMTVIKDHHLEQYDQEFGLKCSLKIKIWIKENESVLNKLHALDNVTCKKIHDG